MARKDWEDAAKAAGRKLYKAPAKKKSKAQDKPKGDAKE